LLADGTVVATHPRHTKELILIDVRHYEGERIREEVSPHRFLDKLLGDEFSSRDLVQPGPGLS
jgi:hypothetical protein